MLYPALLPLMRTSRLPVVEWTDAPADLNELVRFAERLNLVSARVQSYFNWPVHYSSVELVRGMWPPMTRLKFGAQGRVVIVTSPSKRYSLKVFGLRGGLWIFLRARAQIANTFQRNSFACGNLSLLAPYVTLIQAHCGACYRLAPQQLPDWPASESGPALTTYISTCTGWFRRISQYFRTWEYRSLWDFSNNF